MPSLHSLIRVTANEELLFSLSFSTIFPILFWLGYSHKFQSSLPSARPSLSSRRQNVKMWRHSMLVLVDAISRFSETGTMCHTLRKENSYLEMKRIFPNRLAKPKTRYWPCCATNTFRGGRAGLFGLGGVYHSISTSGVKMQVLVVYTSWIVY